MPGAGRCPRRHCWKDPGECHRLPSRPGGQPRASTAGSHHRVTGRNLGPGTRHPSAPRRSPRRSRPHECDCDCSHSTCSDRRTPTCCPSLSCPSTRRRGHRKGRQTGSPCTCLLVDRQDPPWSSDANWCSARRFRPSGSRRCTARAEDPPRLYHPSTA